MCLTRLIGGFLFLKYIILMQINKPVAGKAFIKGLLVRCHIGINEEEQKNAQDILINVELTTDMSDAIATDDLSKTADYVPAYWHILEIAQNSRYNLIETLGNAVAEYCFSYNNRIQTVTVRVEKPHRFPFLQSVGIEITRSRS